jgi:hypothetical protein
MLRRNRHTVLVLLLAAGAALVAFARPEPQAISWQYRVELGTGLDISGTPQEREAQRRAIEATFNTIAGEGFELIQVLPGGAVFRRPR